MKGAIDHIYASGAKRMDDTIDTTDIVDRRSAYVGIYGKRAIQLTVASHGYLVGDAKKPTSLLIRGLANYENGLYRVVAVATNTIDVITRNKDAFVASDTPAGTETINPGYLCREKCKFIGFKLHLSAAGANEEDFEIHFDSIGGANFDAKTYDYSTNGVQDIVNMFDPPIHLEAGDMVYCTWANAGDKTWALELIFERIGA